MLILCVYQWLSHVAQWTSAHEAFCMAALTFGLVLCSVVSCYIGVKGIQATRRLEEEKSRPYVVFETFYNIPFFGVRMANVGQTPAYNISVESEPIIWLFGDQSKEYKERPIAFMNSTMPYLAPSGKIETELGNLDSIRRANPSLRFKVLVSYDDSRGSHYSDEVILDYSFFDDLMYSGKKNIHNLVEEIAKTNRVLGEIASGAKKPHVLIDEFLEYRRREDEWIRHACADDSRQKIQEASLSETLKNNGEKECDNET